MQTISREEARQKLSDEGVSVVEVLDAEHYREFHLPGAVNVPLDDRFDERIQEVVLDKTKPVVIYCLDIECEAAQQAAQRMEALGYQEVYDYEPGKVDWRAAGLPVES